MENYNCFCVCDKIVLIEKENFNYSYFENNICDKKAEIFYVQKGTTVKILDTFLKDIT